MSKIFILVFAYILTPLHSYGITIIPPSKVVPAVYFGIHNIRFHDQRMLPSVNAGAVRLWDTGTAWSQLEPQKGVWDFRRLDLAIRNAKSRNQDIILTLGRPPKWASSKPDQRSFYGPGEAAPPRSTDDFEAYVEAVAKRYINDIHYFEVWNEPASSGMFSGTVSQMVELTASARKAVKRASTSNKLICPSPAKFESLNWFESFAMAGGLSHCDIIGYHFYTDHPLPEKRIELHQSLMKIIEKYNAQFRPLWDTESGTDTQEVNNQLNISRSAYLARWLIITWAIGIERFYWYAWDHDRRGFINPNTGVLLSDLKRSYETVQRWMIGSYFSTCAEESSRWRCNLTLPNGSKGSIFWSELETANTFIDLKGAALIEDISGFSAKPNLSDFPLTTSPVLVVWQ